ncbi:MAG TPA: hypothetical protein VFV57_04915, partial [Limnobacter sp.]|nr:hypothetical protein [Limnobacter sp.]
MRVIEMNTAVSQQLEQFEHYPVFVFELIEIPQQRVLQQLRIQKAIQLSDGRSLPFKGTMDVIPDRHAFRDGILEV